MKLMTYNIYAGAAATFDTIIEIVNREAPDFLTLNEANGFDLDKNRLLDEFAQRTVAIFSRKPFASPAAVRPLSRAAIVAVINTPIGEVAICGTHLSPHSEDIRLKELKLILDVISPYEHKILLGDLNSLSIKDSYPDSIIKDFTHEQLRKFTTNEKVRYDLINSLINNGFNDIAVLVGKQATVTVPTPVNTDTSHSKMRLDYIMVSDSLKEHIMDYEVVKNDLTTISSDHYPIVADLDI